jgi:hypothetical protein
VPQRDVGRLYRLPYHLHQFVAQRALVRETEARTCEALAETLGRVLLAVTTRDTWATSSIMATMYRTNICSMWWLSPT